MYYYVPQRTLQPIPYTPELYMHTGIPMLTCVARVTCLQGAVLDWHCTSTTSNTTTDDCRCRFQPKLN